ncbi:class I fructose-bisphosphate aldolase [Mucilaginibacter sp. UR6-11]|uniref:class I fructose-bisphosphate aldolase n=1 Tax=Mucilaginibacter sp. UR6-11 TaxID=1435644 RepID=UPI001E50E9D4|nr:class I fructose-bisphosphate aldolase [Mucilaginibacter sp. UR6-11]MCC8423456.1 fructose-bisphosphate aldolase class I [Mucilaginibacter sp. UR6-11]
MNTEELQQTTTALMAGDKGLLAMDESLPTCNKRFQEAGIPQTEEYRRKYRQLIVTTPNLGEYISGAILFDETVYQSTDDQVLFMDVLHRAGIIPGIKVDEGTVEMPGHPKEKITRGLDGLTERLNNYYGLGARFAKWRAVITIGEGIPSDENIAANTKLLARYALLCQQADIVPIVEPEVLMDGDHTIERCYEVTEKTIKVLFTQLQAEGVYLPGLILKPNMVIAGKDCPVQKSTDEVATATVNCLLASVPPEVGGVAFLSGGQSPQEAARHLHAMHVKFDDKLPWPLTFSFARALQQPALELWKGKDENVKAAQDMLYFRASMASAARAGQYSVDIDN